MHPGDPVRAARYCWAIVGVLVGVAACSDTTDYETRLVQRPLGLAVTCADSAGTPIGLERCSEVGTTRTGWVLDADVNGLAALNLDNGRHLDADPFLPGFNAVPLGGMPIAVRGTTDSRHVVVALLHDDTTGGPSLVRAEVAELVDNPSFERQPLPCVPVDLVFGQAALAGKPDPGVPSILVLMACSDHARLVAIDIEEFGQTDLSDPLDASGWTVPGMPLSLGVSAEGTVAYVASTLAYADEVLGLPAGDVLTRLDLLAPDGTLGARTSVAIGDPGRMGTYAQGQSDAGLCVADGEDSGPVWPPTRVRGAAAVSPDGGLVYLPMGEPAGVAVFTGDLERIDVQAATAGVDDSGDPLLAHLGFQDISLRSPAVAVTFVTVEVGLRAIVTTESGDVVRIVAEADADHPVPHVVEASEDQGESAASSPETRFDGEWIPSAYLTRPDLASFGSTEIVTIPERDGLYRYYGIEFHAADRRVLSESWTVVYEGTIPGTRRCGLIELDETGATLVDTTADFCALGVREDGVVDGDIVVLRPELPLNCGDGVFGASLEYRVAGVSAGRLELVPAFASLPLPPSGCLVGPVPYEIRVNDGWAVVGSMTGFLHGRGLVEGACVDLPDADPLLTGRAYAPTPRLPSGRVTACPIRDGDPEFATDVWEDSLFVNPLFQFRVVPGCRLGADFLPQVTPEIRDTALSFRVSSGFRPLGVSLSGLPAAGIVVAGERAFVSDAAFGLVYELDIEGMSVVSSRY